MSNLKQILYLLPETIRDYYLEFKYNKQIKKWNNEGKPLPTPHAIKQLVIKDYQQKYNIETLVETGTYLGDMVYAQRKLFRQIYTIELSPQLYKLAKKRFKKHNNIEVIQGDSAIILEGLIGSVTQKAIFWLDGHYSGGITAKSSKESPIIEELSFILKSSLEHVILIDDAREFVGANGYPTIEELGLIIKENKFSHSTIEIKDDIIRIELKLAD